MVISIHYLRGIAALLVVLFHLRGYINNAYAHSNLGDLLFVNGAFGVDLFFVISGFIICFATREKECYYPIKFVIRRFFRIYPLLIISMLVYFIFLTVKKGSTGLDSWFLWSIAPLQIDYHAGAPYFGYNVLAIAWTLTYEISFYIIFLISMIISHKHRATLCASIILAMVLITQLCSANPTLEGENTNYIRNDFITLISSPIYLDFVYGIISYAVYNNFLPALNKYRGSILNTLLILITTLTTALVFTTKHNDHGPLGWGGMAFVIVVSMSLLEKSFSTAKIKPLNLLGNISFSLYMCHFIFIEIITAYFPNIPINGFTALVLMTACSIAIASITFKVIETPSVKMSKKIIAWIDRKNFERIVR
ncbi:MULTISPECIES: acyltransferase [unclassified Enterobacter]|uniref:acyltransferase family protein n=1 Tax=unclassified Enterobacter TaxID=2608935 RepID=UPI000F10D3C6|nr:MULTISPECIES: acyltransferase [unclassified Enterobacter]RMA89637.1 peptidoglycan/LPS O-acetylase OafA/YrhL [Enterobacter sp. WP_7_1]RMA99605.1 peptidoglycan/LPS O-acetylase OafA/YrhL [Enterobacter sp. WP_7_2]